MNHGGAPATRPLLGPLPTAIWASAGIGVVVIGTSAAMAGPAPMLAAAAIILLSIPVAWVLSSPSRALVLYAFAIPIDVYLSTTLRVTTTQVLQVAIVGAWVVQSLLAPRRPREPGARPVLPYRLGAALLAFLLASIAWAAAPEASARTVVRIVAAILLAVYAAEHVSPRTLPRVLAALCAGAVVTAIYGYLQWLRGGYDALYPFFSPFYTDPFMTRGGGFAIVATFANPNILAGYLLMVMPVAWAGLAVPGRAARAGWVLASVVLGGALLLTFSKGSWLLLGLLAGLWVLGRLPIGTTLSGVAMAGLAIGVVLFYLDPIWRTLTFLFPDSREASVDTRLALWRTAISVFLERPLLGFGPDGFATATVGMRAGVLADLTRAHNMYLQALVDHGVVGSVLLWGTCGAIVRRAWSSAGVPRPSPDAARHLGLLLGAAAFFFYGFVETLNVSNQYVNTLWLILGLLAASTRHAELQSGARR